MDDELERAVKKLEKEWEIEKQRDLLRAKILVEKKKLEAKVIDTICNIYFSNMNDKNKQMCLKSLEPEYHVAQEYLYDFFYRGVFS